jgi:hypothetical protein
MSAPKVEDRLAALEAQLADLTASHERTIKLNSWVKYQLIALLKKFGMYEERSNAPPRTNAAAHGSTGRGAEKTEKRKPYGDALASLGLPLGLPLGLKPFPIFPDKK